MSATGTCDHCGRKDIVVHCPAGFAGRKEDMHGHPPRFDVPVDACIAKIVASLNAAGVLTVNACCGHGEGEGSILLLDGRELVLAEVLP